MKFHCFFLDSQAFGIGLFSLSCINVLDDCCIYFLFVYSFQNWHLFLIIDMPLEDFLFPVLKVY